MSDPAEAEYRTFEDVAAEIPRYEAFFTVAEHAARTRDLAADYDHVVHEVIGESTEGTEIDVLTIGEGSKTALMFAAPHPNEPIGSMTLDFLSRKLAEDDDVRESLDYTFVLVKVIDVDGTKLNQGWFDGPFTISNYAQNFYRPASDEQIEWSFPIEYNDYSFDDPEPGTKALMTLIETHKPEFIYSLHNAGFGGCYYYLSDDLPDVYDDLRRISRDRDVPLDLGEPETPYMDEFDDAVFQMPSMMQQYDYYTTETDHDPTEVMESGGGSFDYARRFNEDVFELVTELPYFYDPTIESDTETDRTRREVNLAGIERHEAIVEFLGERFRAVADELPDSRLKRTIAELVEKSPQRLDAQRQWAESDPALTETATEAQVFDAEPVREFYRLLYFGTFMRALDRTAMTGMGDEATLTSTKRVVEREFTDRVEALLDEFEYTTIPIRRLVAIQVQAGLICLDYLDASGHFE